jgi:hypothetical protein
VRLTVVQIRDGKPEASILDECTCHLVGINQIGTNGVVVDRADVEARLGKWTNKNDPRIVRPARVEASDDECPF